MIKGSLPVRLKLNQLQGISLLPCKTTHSLCPEMGFVVFGTYPDLRRSAVKRGFYNYFTLWG
jgi:hypothetical protein